MVRSHFFDSPSFIIFGLYLVIFLIVFDYIMHQFYNNKPTIVSELIYIEFSLAMRGHVAWRFNQ